VTYIPEHACLVEPSVFSGVCRPATRAMHFERPCMTLAAASIRQVSSCLILNPNSHRVAEHRGQHLRQSRRSAPSRLARGFAVHPTPCKAASECRHALRQKRCDHSRQHVRRPAVASQAVLGADAGASICEATTVSGPFKQHHRAGRGRPVAHPLPVWKRAELFADVANRRGNSPSCGVEDNVDASAALIDSKPTAPALSQKTRQRVSIKHEPRFADSRVDESARTLADAGARPDHDRTQPLSRHLGEFDGVSRRAP